MWWANNPPAITRLFTSMITNTSSSMQLVVLYIGWGLFDNVDLGLDASLKHLMQLLGAEIVRLSSPNSSICNRVRSMAARALQRHPEIQEFNNQER